MYQFSGYKLSAFFLPQSLCLCTIHMVQIFLFIKEWQKMWSSAMKSSPTPGRTLITNAPSWEHNARLDKFPCGISTLGIFIKLSYYPVQLCSCNQGCRTCLNMPTVSLSLFFSFSLLQDDSHSNWTLEDILSRGKILEARGPFLVRC